MIRTSENSPQTLKVRFGNGPFEASRFHLDRDAGTAEIAWLVLGLPVRKTSVALSKVSRVSVQRTKGQTTYNPSFEIRGARSIAMTGMSKSEAMEVVRLIRTFLSPSAGKHDVDDHTPLDVAAEEAETNSRDLDAVANNSSATSSEGASNISSPPA